MFLHVFLGVPLNAKNGEEGHRASFLVFWAHSKAVPLNTKNGEEGHRAFFLVFWAVPQNIKNDEEGHPRLRFLGAFKSGVTKLQK